MTQADVQVEQVARAIRTKAAELAAAMGRDRDADAVGWINNRDDILARAAILAYEATRPKVDELVEALRKIEVILEATPERSDFVDDLDQQQDEALCDIHQIVRAALQQQKSGNG